MILHVVNAHLDLTATENEIRNCHATFGGISATLIEDKANGPSVVRHLEDTIAGVIAVNPEGGKMGRMMAAVPEFQAHNWIIERNGPWTAQLVTQLTLFPVAKHDDLADCVSQASIWLQSHTYELGLLDFFKKVASGATKMVRGVPDLLTRRPGVAAEESKLAKATQVDNFQIWLKTNKAPPCLLCGNTSTTFNEQRKVRCNQCSAMNGKLQETATICDCGNFLPQYVAGLTRCGNCGWQSAAPAVAGMSRAEYRSRTTRFERFG